jgi:AbrB family looped-hinge helix DNA binding protein
MDKAGRLVIPKVLRDRVGLRPGDVEVVADGTSVRVEPLVDKGLVREGVWLVIPPAGSPVSDEDVRALRDVDQR